MPITGPIPLPDTGINSFLEGLKKFSEARRESAKANLPFGGAIPPGPAGQTVGLEMVRMLYGENSPQFQQAKKMYDLGQESTQARLNYQNILSGSAPKRFSTTLGKTAQEYEDIKRGYLPGTTIPLTDEQKKQYEGQYGLSILKGTTDTDTRKKNLYAHNMDITIDSIDPDSLTQYSGLKGSSELIKDAASSASGNPNEKYEKYQNSLTAARTLAKQVRQFYGDSITPEIQKGLKTLTNPGSWLLDPKIAKSNYNKFINLLRSESTTYQKAAESPEIYSGKKSTPLKPLSKEEQIQHHNIENGKTIIIDSNGKEHTIDLDKIEEARKRDPGIKVKKESYNAARI